MIADLIPQILATRIERRPLTRWEMQKRWLDKGDNRKKFNAYRRKWWAKRRAA